MPPIVAFTAAIVPEELILPPVLRLKSPLTVIDDAEVNVPPIETFAADMLAPVVLTDPPDTMVKEVTPEMRFEVIKEPDTVIVGKPVIELLFVRSIAPASICRRLLALLPLITAAGSMEKVPL